MSDDKDNNKLNKQICIWSVFIGFFTIMILLMVMGMMVRTGYSPFDYYSHGTCKLTSIDYYDTRGQYFWIFEIKLDDYDKILHYADYYNPLFASLNISQSIDCWSVHQTSYGQSLDGDLYYENTIKDAKTRPYTSLVIFIGTFFITMSLYLIGFFIYATEIENRQMKKEREQNKELT